MESAKFVLVDLFCKLKCNINYQMCSLSWTWTACLPLGTWIKTKRFHTLLNSISWRYCFEVYRALLWHAHVSIAKEVNSVFPAFKYSSKYYAVQDVIYLWGVVSLFAWNFAYIKGNLSIFQLLMSSHLCCKYAHPAFLSIFDAEHQISSERFRLIE